MGERKVMEVLFALKLRAHRPQDRADVTALIDAGAGVPAIERWLTEHKFTMELKRLRAILSQGFPEP